MSSPSSMKSEGRESGVAGTKRKSTGATPSAGDAGLTSGVKVQKVEPLRASSTGAPLSLKLGKRPPSAPPAAAPTGISLKLGASKPAGAPAASPAVLKPKSSLAAAAFAESDDSDEEEMPAQAKMRMKNIGRDTPTSAGPNSFGKTKIGFCDSKKLREKELAGGSDEDD